MKSVRAGFGFMFILGCAVVASCAESGPESASAAYEPGETPEKWPEGSTSGGAASNPETNTADGGAALVAETDCVENEGRACGDRDCDADFGACMAVEVCALSGIQTRHCIERVCKKGECVEHEAVETRSCERETEGVACAERSCDAEWGSCSYGSTCAESGSRKRDCNDYACRAGECAPVAVTETDTAGCGRNTDGSSCGSTTCGGCYFNSSNNCDTQADKLCTQHECSGGSCQDATYYSSTGCGTRSRCQANTSEYCNFIIKNGCAVGVDRICPGEKKCNSNCELSACTRTTSGACPCDL